MRSILQFEKRLRKTTSANKIITSEREARNNARETRKTKIEAKKTKANTKVDARASAKVTITTTTTTTITTNRKQLSKLRKQFACTYVSLVFEITSILLSYLLLFNNLRECASNTLYSQKLIKFLN